METTLNITKQDLNAGTITEEHKLFFGHVFRGKSAYQYAVESGLFDGTEEEFAEHLGNIKNVTNDANKATANANQSAERAVQIANTAAAGAEQATADAEVATEKANEAAFNAEKAAEKVNNKQDTLISGENIKTYGGRTLLGSGDLLDEFEPAPNEIFYTNGSTTEPSVINGDKFTFMYSNHEPDYQVEEEMSSGLISNTYDWDKGCWVLKFGSQVEYIKDFAFGDRDEITRIVLPEGVKEVHRQAFNCYGLQRINIPTTLHYSKEAFNGAYNIKRVDIKRLNAWLNINFESYDCNPLTVSTNRNSLLYLKGEPLYDIQIPYGVDVNAKAFMSYKALRSVKFTGNNSVNIGISAFYGCSGLEEIKGTCGIVSPGAFGSCSALKSVIVDRNIGDRAFADCTALESVSINSRCAKIGSKAFLNCTALESVTIGTGLKSVDSTPFQNCTGTLTLRCTALEEDYTTSTATNSLGNAILQGSNFSKVIIDVPVIGAYAFYKCSYDGEVEIGSNTTVRNSIFSSSSLTRAVIGDNVQFVLASGQPSYSIFNTCRNLYSIRIGNITSLCANIFSGCTNLEEVEIPISVENVAKNAFKNCSFLQTIYCKGITPPTLEATLPEQTQIVVPLIALSEYMTTNWCANAIVGTAYMNYIGNELFPALFSLEQRLLATNNNLGRLETQKDELFEDLARSWESIAELESAVGSKANAEDVYTVSETDEAILKSKNEILGITDGATLNQAYDTLVEVANWIEQDTSGAAAMQAEINTLKTTTSNIASNVATNEADIIALRDDIATLGEQAASAESSVTELRSEIYGDDGIDTKLTALEQNVYTKEEIDTKLQSKASVDSVFTKTVGEALIGRVDTLEQVTTDGEEGVGSRLDLMELNIDGNSQGLSDLESSISSGLQELEERVEALEGNTTE